MAHHRASTGEATLRLWLELDLDAEPIRGTLRQSGGPSSTFTGWLGLSAALERLREVPEAGKSRGGDRNGREKR